MKIVVKLGGATLSRDSMLPPKCVPYQPIRTAKIRATADVAFLGIRIITGDYPSEDRWRPSELNPGRKLPAPQALFKRLDEVVEEIAESS